MGAGGVAVGVHTTQSEIRDPRIGLFEPVLELAMEELRRFPNCWRASTWMSGCDASTYLREY